MKRHFGFLTIIISLFLFSFSEAQVAFDVKTSLQEKKELHIIKIALINSLRQSNWAIVKEVGEDYSLWIENLNRSSVNNSIRTDLDFELRTPSMFSNGKHIMTRHISVLLDTTGIGNIPLSSSQTDISNLLIKVFKSSGITAQLASLMPNFVAASIITMVSGFVLDMMKEMSRKPTPLESLESNLVATQAMIELNQLMNSYSTLPR